MRKTETCTEKFIILNFLLFSEGVSEWIREYFSKSPRNLNFFCIVKFDIKGERNIYCRAVGNEDLTK